MSGCIPSITLVARDCLNRAGKTHPCFLEELIADVERPDIDILVGGSEARLNICASKIHAALVRTPYLKEVKHLADVGVARLRNLLECPAVDLVGQGQGQGRKETSNVGR